MPTVTPPHSPPHLSGTTGRFGVAHRIDTADDAHPAWSGLGHWSGAARSSGLPITVAEACVGREIPPHAERLEWRAELPRPLRQGIVVYTDAARLGEVWSWVEWRPIAGPCTVEHRLPGREATLDRGLRELRTRRAGAPVAPTPPAAIQVAQALAAARGLFEGLAPATPAGVQRRVEAAGEVGALRRAWKAGTTLRVLDPECRDASWLLDAAAALEDLYLALLERMRVWVDEPRGQGRRPEYLKDFRALVEAAEHPRFAFDRRPFVRRSILQHNLFAAAPDGRAARRCMGALASWAALDRPPTALDLNVWSGRLPRWAPSDGPDTGQGAPRQDGPGDRPPALTRTSATVDSLTRAWRGARAARLLDSAPEHEFSRAARQIEARCRALLRQDGGDGPAEARWPLVFPGIRGRGDFAVERGG